MPPDPPPPHGSRPRPEVRAAVVMLAAGDGRRVGAHTNKVLLPLAGRRVFTWSIRWARQLPAVARTLLVIREEDREEMVRVVDREVVPPSVDIVAGGSTRHASEWHALQALEADIETGEIDVVVIHDAARPLAGTELFADVVAAAAEHGGAVPVREQHHLTTATGAGAPADQVVTVQTPQAFLARPLLEAYRQAEVDGFVGTDTASCIERYTELPVWCVPGDGGNIKITFPEDLFLAERLLATSRWDLSGRYAAPPGRRHRHGRHGRPDAGRELGAS